MRKADRQLSPAELEQFGAEIEAIRQKHLADIGERDVKYITKIEKAVRYSEIAGRAMLMAGVDAETALRGANAKFERRFRRVEEKLYDKGRSPAESDLAEMDKLWDEAKKEERA